MKLNKSLLIAELVTTFALLTSAGQAGAYMHSNGFGGHTVSNGNGSWAHEGARGGTASGSDGSWSAHGADGGSAYGYHGADGGAWHATGANGGSFYGASYNGYHPPTVVNTYGAGCYNCGGWNAGAAAVTGLAVGAAVGASAANAQAANAYAAGVATGASMAPVYMVNSVYSVLPPTCSYSPVNGVTLYRCGAVWFTPFYGANGVNYRVVNPPY